MVGPWPWSLLNLLFAVVWVIAVVEAWHSANRVVPANRPWTRAWRILVASIFAVVELAPCRSVLSVRRARAARNRCTPRATYPAVGDAQRWSRLKPSLVQPGAAMSLGQLQLL